LEHGGNPNLVVDGESVFSDYDFEVMFRINEGENVAYIIKCWLVLMSFGGRFSDGSLPVNMAEGYTPDIFKNYEKFSWNIEYIEKRQDSPDQWTMHIYETATGVEVATR
jgi:hypothetical protein